jgi:cAMP-dependent protein kinase regulator
MRTAPPGLPGSNQTTEESPIDRALALALAEERDAALRWAAALVRADPTMASALLVCGRLLGELGRHEAAREACSVAVARASDVENLPLAVAAAHELTRFGGSAEASLDQIAADFCRDSRRRGEGAAPPPLPPTDRLHPLPSALTGASLLNKAIEIIHEAKRKFDLDVERPLIGALPLFSSIGRAGLRGLIAGMEPLWVTQSTHVIEQGATGSEAYFVARGELEVRRERQPEPLVLAKLTNGSLFGEMALLARAPRSGSVVATRPSIVVRVRRDALDALARSQPEVGSELAAHCKQRMVQNLVRMSPVLAAVAPSDRPALTERFQMRIFEPSEILIHQDEPPPGLFLLASGEVTVLRRDSADDEGLVIARLGVGEIVGEVATVLRRHANADVVASHATVALFLPAEEFLALIDGHPTILIQLYRIAIARDEETTGIIEEEPSSVGDYVLV